MRTYRTFMRAARNIEEFSRAKKIEVQTGLSYGEAREECEIFNTTRSPEQVNAGMKMEFEAEEE